MNTLSLVLGCHWCHSCVSSSPEWWVGQGNVTGGGGGGGGSKTQVFRNSESRSSGVCLSDESDTIMKLHDCDESRSQGFTRIA